MGLAERKVKQRIMPDPRNKAWENDKSKFGFKMLERMGWSEGKGLGVDENGRQDFIKVIKKSDTIGIGGARKTADNWLENADAFENILANLNQINDSEAVVSDSDSSVNELPNLLDIQQTRATPRFSHRAKFLKAKQMSTSNASELDAILGVKENRKPLNSSSVVLLEEVDFEDEPVSRGLGFSSSASLKVDTSSQIHGVPIKLPDSQSNSLNHKPKNSKKIVALSKIDSVPSINVENQDSALRKQLRKAKRKLLKKEQSREDKSERKRLKKIKH